MLKSTSLYTVQKSHKSKSLMPIQMPLILRFFSALKRSYMRLFYTLPQICEICMSAAPPPIINHRAKRGGSLFQGGSSREEGRQATHPRRRSPPCKGREATLEMLEGSPPFVSFCYAKCPKRQRIWTKLCRKQLLVKPH